MEVVKDDGFTTMAEVLPRNERTEKIIAQRAAEQAAKQEKAEAVSSICVSTFTTMRQTTSYRIHTCLTVSKFELLNLEMTLGENCQGAR